jgi:hypothetical protein
MSNEARLERMISALEKQNNVNDSLLKVSENMRDNIKELNDKFVLHCTNADTLTTEVKLIRKELFKWIKILATIAFLAVGGGSILTFLVQKGLLKL